MIAKMVTTSMCALNLVMEDAHECKGKFCNQIQIHLTEELAAGWKNLYIGNAGKLKGMYTLHL